MVRKQTECQLYAGGIEPTKAEWTSLFLLTPKKDGKMNLCVDLRLLNTAIFPDTNNFPRIMDSVERLSTERCSRFSSTSGVTGRSLLQKEIGTKRLSPVTWADIGQRYAVRALQYLIQI